MKRAILMFIVLVFCLSFVGTTFATLSIVSPPTSEPEPCYCGTGYWKNHPEVWETWAGDSFQDILNALQARGPGSEDIRALATDYLNDIFTGACPCEE